MKRKASTGSPVRTAKANLDTLMQCWRRAPFHDQVIERIVFVNRRLVVALEDYTLVMTDARDFKSGVEELPASWLYEAITAKGDRFAVKVETELGDFSVTCADFRLFQTEGLKILVPPVDP